MTPPAVHVWRAAGPLGGLARSGAEARELLLQATTAPTVELYPRADGPGSSQDLPQFAAAAHRVPSGDIDLAGDWSWSKGCLRTPGICLDGAPIRFFARPADDPAAFEYYAPDFHDRPQSVREPLPAEPRYFVLNVLRQFGLTGVRIEAEPMPAVYRGAGLGGSNLAHAAALVLASALAGARLGLAQIYVWASQLENTFGLTPRDDGDFEGGAFDGGVSMTGGQETLTALQGGVWDNVHLPSHLGPFGVVSRELVPSERYPELTAHLLLVNVGVRRQGGVTSSAVNRRWMAAWRSPEGAALHLEKLGLAWQGAEALRRRDWPAYADALRRYREVRATLCPDYLHGQEELATLGRELGFEHFPVGAGTGACLIAAEDPAAIVELDQRIAATADPAHARVALPVVPRRQGIVCPGFEELGLDVPSGPSSS